MPIAEHAIRWDPSQGGPQHLSQVARTLGLHEGKWKHMTVRYFSVAGPVDLPPGYRLIGRERSGPDGTECMVKLRGPSPLPEPLLQWAVPLQGELKLKQEFDVSWGAEGPLASALSVSGTVVSASLQQALTDGYQATPYERTHQMVRLKDKALDITVEAWLLHSGRQIIEVSAEGEVGAEGWPADVATDTFHLQVVHPLAAWSVKALAQGLTTLAEQS